MIKRNQYGAVNGGLLAFILVILLLMALAFGVWAYIGRQHYKTNSAAIVAAAVTVAKQQEDVVKDAQFAVVQAQPLRTYNGPETYGSLVVQYPKTWSGYVDDTGSGSALVDGYFASGVVPPLTNTNSNFALRVQVVAQSYSQTLQSLTGSGTAKVNAYALPKVPKAVGVEITGKLSGGKSGTMVVLPLRDKTLQIWTEGDQFLNDFNAYILPNFSFAP